MTTINVQKPEGISDLLVEVSYASSFEELAEALRKVSTDFERIIESDTNGTTDIFIRRFKELKKMAITLLQKTNGNSPAPEEKAIFGEMVALRDFCFKRLVLD